MSKDGGQTTFSYGNPHYSPGHANHTRGSTDPIQKDLQLRNPDGSLNRNLGGIGLGNGGQMTLPDFGINKP